MLLPDRLVPHQHPALVSFPFRVRGKGQNNDDEHDSIYMFKYGLDRQKVPAPWYDTKEHDSGKGRVND